MESGSGSENKAREPSGRIMSLARRRMPAWRALWRKLKKRKGRVFHCCDGDPTHFGYDPFAYALNFDPGPTLDDPGDISRTFSARFAAVPSRIFLQGE